MAARRIEKHCRHVDRAQSLVPSDFNNEAKRLVIREIKLTNLDNYIS